jgi:hypothetical protein
LLALIDEALAPVVAFTLIFAAYPLVNGIFSAIPGGGDKHPPSFLLLLGLISVVYDCDCIMITLGMTMFLSIIALGLILFGAFSN